MVGEEEDNELQNRDIPEVEGADEPVAFIPPYCTIEPHQRDNRTFFEVSLTIPQLTDDNLAPGVVPNTAVFQVEFTPNNPDSFVVYHHLENTGRFISFNINFTPPTTDNFETVCLLVGYVFALMIGVVADSVEEQGIRFIIEQLELYRLQEIFELFYDEIAADLDVILDEEDIFAHFDDNNIGADATAMQLLAIIFVGDIHMITPTRAQLFYNNPPPNMIFRRPRDGVLPGEEPENQNPDPGQRLDMN